MIISKVKDKRNYTKYEKKKKIVFAVLDVIFVFAVLDVIFHFLQSQSSVIHSIN